MSATARPVLVVGYDGRPPSIKAIDEAFEQARVRGAEVLVLVVAGVPGSADPYALGGLGGGVIQPIPAEGPIEIQYVLSEARRRVEESGIDGTVEWSLGDPAGEILRVAKEHNAEAIVVATHHHSALGRLLGTDTAADLKKDAPCDVLVAR